MTQQSYDLVAIGTGSAALAVASRCRKAGWSVAVVDFRPYGGTCALRGCDPKKVLIAAAEALQWGRRLEGHGIDPGNARIDWRELMAFKEMFVGTVPEDNERWLAGANIDAFHGVAKFISRSAVQVEESVLEAKHFVIAAGAKPTKLGFPGEEHLITSTDFLDLNELPARIAFVGGGYISMEFANIAVRAGARVTVLHRGSRPLRGFDPDLMDKVILAARGAGVDLKLETLVERMAKTASGVTVEVSSPSGSQTLEADVVVHGAGRVPEIDDLDLATAGVDSGMRGVLVNQFLQSVSNSTVYAAGDAADTAGYPLTPVAALEGQVVAHNLLNGNEVRPDYRGTPTVAFTLPPIAAVGLGEKEARSQGLKWRVNFQDTSGWYSSRRVGEEFSASKVLVQTDTGKILGAHLLGPSADELINIFALAIRRGLTADDLKDTIFAYPTHASDVGYMV